MDASKVYCTQEDLCMNGGSSYYMCHADQSFDVLTQECKDREEVLCPRLPPTTPYCDNQTDGYYPDYREDCRKYYRCVNGTLANSGEWCEEGAIWDIATGSCGAGSQVTCSAPVCWGLGNGPHPMTGSKCAAYFECNSGVRTDKLCPYGTVFDYMQKECVSSSQTVCYESACDDKVNGLHAAASASCQTYFDCFNGGLSSLQECPFGQIFDGYGCSSSENFTCWNGEGGSCEGKPDGYYPVADYTCRGFIMCRNQQLIRAFRCRAGMVFNGEKCIDNENLICSSRPLIPDCKDKVDGYYTVENTACKFFFQCRKRKKISEHTCPGQYVFNGEQCVSPNLFKCKSLDSVHVNGKARDFLPYRTMRNVFCRELSDGYYLEIASNCTKLYYCESGKRTIVMSCPKRYISDYHCIDDHNSRCLVLPNSEDCLEEDGLFQDFLDDCKSFYECSKGIKIVYKCPVGMSHNGKECRPSSEVICSGANY